MKRNIMIQGTASSVGKSIMVAALCRILNEDGHAVAPFKSQNMALNSFVTKEGLEMGRAQVVQAEAARIGPSVLMNPVLLKPTADSVAQVILKGKVKDNMTAADYHAYKPQLRGIIKEVYDELADTYDTIVIEGAGSPVEINLREHDIVNMGLAELVDAPVVLIADIDRGGVFASIVGTMELLSPAEKKRVKGVVINKFRGDIDILKPGLVMLEEKINVPVLGVIPYTEINIEDEDSVTEKFSSQQYGNKINICIIRLPRISNFTDFDAFRMYDDVQVRYAERATDIGNDDIIIIPGSKNTIADLRFLKEQGFDAVIQERYSCGTLVIGICGGYQMLGKTIADPYAVEEKQQTVDALGLIDMDTVLCREKVTTQTSGTFNKKALSLGEAAGKPVAGYEIHMGRSAFSRGMDGLEHLAETNNGIDGVIGDHIIGTYIHGIFDNSDFTSSLLDSIRPGNNMQQRERMDYREYKESRFNALAELFRKHVDISRIYSIINGG